MYWEKIYSEVSEVLKDCDFPVKECVMNPIPYLSDIKDWDVIVLDNYFPTEFWEWPLWEDFLWQYLKLWLRCHIICVSNVWERIIKRFEQRCRTYNQWDILWFVPSKSWDEITDLILKVL